MPYLGENPVTSVDVNHPTAALVRQKLDQTRKSLLTEGWWFNTTTPTLYPDAEQYIAVPKSALSILAPGLEVRGTRLYNLKEATYKFPSAVTILLVEDMVWDELPSVAQEYLQWQAGVLCYMQDFGVEKTMMVLQELAREAKIAIARDHLRNSKFNSTKNRRGARMTQTQRGGFYDDFRR